MADGRLSMTEFEGRLDVVYSARTRGELAEVVADLPQAHRRSAASAADRPPARGWAPWALTGAICLVIWIVTSLAQGRPTDFWPFWVIIPWGVILLGRAGARHARRAAPGR